MGRPQHMWIYSKHQNSLTKAINRSDIKLILTYSLMRFSSCTLFLGSSILFWFVQVRLKNLVQGTESHEIFSH